MRRWRPNPLSLLAAVAVVAAVTAVIVGSPASVPRQGVALSQPPAGGEPVQISVKAGDSAASIGDRLESAHVIDNATSFQRLARISGTEKGLVAGDYEFLPGTSVQDALTRIRAGLTSARVVVIPEGLRQEEVAKILEQRGVVKAADFLVAVNAYTGGPGVDPALLAGRTAGSGLEGYLYPATYSFGRSATPNDVVQAMVKALADRLTPQLQQQIKSRNMSVDDVLTLASIVEREAQRPEDKPLIASVYLNRLKQQMPLQSDPTVQYAVASADKGSVQQYGFWKEDLTQQDLKLASPYNTYTKVGLPAGPISNPDIDSIEAVLNPAQTSYLYFLAKSDGSIVYATTFEEHQRNAEKYLR